MDLKMASLTAHRLAGWLMLTLAWASAAGADPPLHPQREADHWGTYLQWTSISQSTKSGVDLWTKTDKGCACPWNVKNKSCACCTPGGCHCGERVPKRCGQCGIEHQCDTMCNVTLDAGQLMATSRQPYGHIKSLELHDSQECWYRFQPQRGSRVELQIYRLIDTGYLNQNRCEDGHLEWQVGPKRSDVSQAWRLCGPNLSYSPPVLLFSDSDQSPATLTLKAGKGTRRGKLFAHFVFTPTGHEQLGLRTSGGQPIRSADCHWLYQDADCVNKHNNTCSMASPGFPGLYPPNRRCHYRIVIHSPFQRLRLQFQSVHLPPDRCDTDNIRIFVNGDLHSTLCSHQPFELVTHGPDVTVEFNSGPFIPPYQYNGFWAKLHFQHVLLDDATANASDAVYKSVTRQPHAVCDYWVRSASLHWPDSQVASGFFSSAQTPWKVWPAPCSFAFVAQRGQSVQLSLFSHNLTSPDCSSQLEIHQGALDVRWSSSPPLHKICAPSVRNARNSQFKFNPPLAVGTFNASLSIRFRLDPQTGAEQFFEGAFAFHNESYGRLVPGTLCHTVIDGRTSPSAAHFSHHWDSAVFWNVVGPVRCNATFVPYNGQTVSLTVNEFSATSNGDQCLTQCDGDGCHCQTVDLTPLEAVDHVIVWLNSYDGSQEAARPALCLCGDVQALLPLTLVSNTKLSVDQYVADYRYGKLTATPRLELAYAFSKVEESCGPMHLNAPSGSVSSHKMGPLPALGAPTSTYFYADCLWMATAQAAQQWTGSISTTFDGKCKEWNVTFHPYNEKRPGLLGHVIDVLCPDRDNNRFIMPHGVNMMAIRLQAWHSTPAEFRLEWRTSPWPGANSASGPDVQGAKSLSSVISVTAIPTNQSWAGSRQNYSATAPSSASAGRSFNLQVALTLAVALQYSVSTCLYIKTI